MSKELDDLNSGETDFIVFTKNDCMQCNATKKQLDKREESYVALNIEEDDSAMELMRELVPGALQAPVVVTRDESWTGFRPDKLRKK